MNSTPILLTLYSLYHSNTLYINILSLYTHCLSCFRLLINHINHMNHINIEYTLQVYYSSPTLLLSINQLVVSIPLSCIDSSNG